MMQNISRREAMGLAAAAGGAFGLVGASGSASGQTTDSSTVPMFRYDAHNSGVAPASGPKEGANDVWTFETGGRLTAQPVVKNGTVFQVSQDSQIYAVSEDRGSEEWSVGTNQALVRTPAVGNGVVYVSTQTGRILALSVANGSGQWSNSTGVDAPSAVTWTDDGVVFGETDQAADHIYNLDSATGEQQLRFTIPDALSFRLPVLAEGRAYVYCQDEDGYHILAAHSLTDGEEVWRTSLPGERYDNLNDSSAVTYASYDGGTIFVADGQFVESRDAASGDRNWQFSDLGNINTIPTFADGTLYVATEESALYAIDPSIGTRQWRTSLNGTPTSPVYADGVLYFGADDNYVYAHEASNGDELWNFQTGGSIVAPPVVVEDRVYAASKDGILYALGEGSGGPLVPDVTGDGNPAQDLDGDGLYEDVNGDGAFTAVDVQALFANLDSDAVQNNIERFDFNGDGKVDVTDVQALFAQLEDQ